ncbi:MAG: C45 family peptidase [Firmicutes bacterium]|nr:C45 family peptidase [Bacillota bacterium]
MKKLLPVIFCVVLVISLCLSSFGIATALEIPDVQATSASPTVIVVSGSNKEMGHQYGIQAADLIFRNINILKSRVIAQYGEELTASDMKVWSYYADKYDSGLRLWLEGMQEGLKDKGYDVDYYDLVLTTVYPAVMWCRPALNTPYPKETGLTLPQVAKADPARGDIHGCTAFAAEGSATADGKPIVGITEMVPKERLNEVIIIAFPEEGNSFISKACAGSVASNGGMNSKGFSWVLTAQWGEPIWGVATEVYFHYLSQYANTPDEAAKFLQETPRAGVTGAFLMSSPEGNIMAVESLSNAFAIRKPGDAGENAPFLVQTNHLVNPSLQKFNGPPERIYTSMNRYVTMFDHIKNAAAKGAVSLETAKAAYSSDDWLDSKTMKWHYNDPGSPSVNNNTSSVAQIVFEPADLTAYLQVGTPGGAGLPGGSTGEYLKLTLGKNPYAVATSAEGTAESYYWAARNLYVKQLNAHAAYLTYNVSESIRGLLDVAAQELEYGMDRAGFAYLAKANGLSDAEQMQLWSDALTHYAKSQLYSQMVQSKLKDLAN